MKLDTPVSEVYPCGVTRAQCFHLFIVPPGDVASPLSLPNQPCWRLVCLHLLMTHVALGCWARRAILHPRYAAGWARLPRGVSTTTYTSPSSVNGGKLIKLGMIMIPWIVAGGARRTPYSGEPTRKGNRYPSVTFRNETCW